MMTRGAAGFTAVEILISVFIGALLLIGGYQAYSLVTGNTSANRERAIASSYGYDALRRLEAQRSTSTCSVVVETNFPAGLVTAPSDIRINSSRYSVTCPYGVGGNISKITTKVSYGNPAKEVSHAIYARNT